MTLINSHTLNNDHVQSCEERSLTGVVAHVCVDRQFADVEGLDDIRVPFPPILDVVEHVVHGLGWDVLTLHPTLRREQNNYITQNAQGSRRRRSEAR